MILLFSSSCWSRGTALSRTTPRISFSWRITRATRTADSARFFLTGLNTSTREQLSGDGPRKSLTAFIEWVLVSCKSKLTMDIADVDTSPTRDLEPGQSPPRSAELPEPTADREPEPASVAEPSPSGATELPIVPEPEPQVSDQVREPTIRAMVETAVEIAGAMDRGGHSSTMAPHSVGSSMGHHHDCGLGLHLTPPAPGFPLAPPTVHSPMDFYDVLCLVCPLSCSTPSSRAPTLPPQLDCYGARTRLSGRGRTVIYLCLHCDLVLPVLFN